MNLSINHHRLQLAVVDSDAEKATRLRSLPYSIVHHFLDVVSFVSFLQTTANTRECLVLLIPADSSKNLPSNIKEIVFSMFIYDDRRQNQFQTFDDVCLHLSSFMIAQCTSQAIHYHHLDESGPARYFAQASLTQSKKLIQQLEDLCDEIDEQISFGQQASN